jgi:hypothetical protein
MQLLTWLKGFGVTARSTVEVRRLDPTAITVFRQADAGEYLREVCTPASSSALVAIAYRIKGRYPVLERQSRKKYCPCIYASPCFPHSGVLFVVKKFFIDVSFSEFLAL